MRNALKIGRDGAIRTPDPLNPIQTAKQPVSPRRDWTSRLRRNIQGAYVDAVRVLRGLMRRPIQVPLAEDIRFEREYAALVARLARPGQVMEIDGRLYVDGHRAYAGDRPRVSWWRR